MEPRHADEVLYVHGLGGAGGGPLERALLAAAPLLGVSVDVLRWRSGDLAVDGPALARERFQRLVSEAIFSGSLRRAAAGALSGALGDACSYWESALAASRDAERRLYARLLGRARGSRPVALLAFSLGVAVAVRALAALPPLALRGLHRVVLAGGALPATELGLLPERLRGSGRVVNVYSTEDAVLGGAWPLVSLSLDAAGRTAVRVSGVRNVCVPVGHGSYASLALPLLALAACPADWRIPRHLELPVGAGAAAAGLASDPGSSGVS